MRYRLPDALGGGEATIVEVDPALQLGGLPAHVLRTDDGVFVVVRRCDLTEVKPPLPEEPPVGAYRVGGVLCMRVSPLPDKCWVYHTADGMFDEMTFAGLCSLYGTDVQRLVPDPFAEPVELPWRLRGVHVQQTTDDGDPGGRVHVSTTGSSYGFAHLKPADARDMARALWAAADAAERNAEPLPEWERELLEGKR